MVLSCPEFDRPASLPRVTQLEPSKYKIGRCQSVTPAEQTATTRGACGAFVYIIAPRNIKRPQHERALKPLTAEGIGREWANGAE
jgi:hypothetical protein